MTLLNYQRQSVWLLSISALHQCQIFSGFQRGCFNFCNTNTNDKFGNTCLYHFSVLGTAFFLTAISGQNALVLLFCWFGKLSAKASSMVIAEQVHRFLPGVLSMDLIYQVPTALMVNVNVPLMHSKAYLPCFGRIWADEIIHLNSLTIFLNTVQTVCLVRKEATDFDLEHFEW